MYVLRNKFYLLVVFLTDIAGYMILSGFRLFWRRHPPFRIKNILIIRLDHIGDVVNSTPLPKTLKVTYPDARLDFLVANWAKDIVASNPYVDRIIRYDAPWFKRGHNKERLGLRDFLKMARLLRANNYDLGLDPRGDLRHILLMFLAGVKFRVGFGVTGGGFLLHRKVKYRKNTHTIEHGLDLLRCIKIEPLIQKPDLYSSLQDENWVNNFFNLHNLRESDRLIAIHAHSGDPARNWSNVKFSELIITLYYKYKFRILLIGSESDKEANENLIRLSNAPGINLAGQTSLGALFALLKRISAFIGVDSGPSHMAAAAGKPTVILYSGVNKPREWAAQGSNVIVIQKDASCKDCHRPECDNNICMDLISTDEVIGALKQVIKI